VHGENFQRAEAKTIKLIQSGKAVGALVNI